ncbi:MAG TPA: MFS transporter [Streptosporangiaceae bacterium]|nr:MFS transporter [Streptosporangiaceae bacterium]
MTTTTGVSPQAGTTGRTASARLILLAAACGFAMIALDATAVNVALPAMGRALGGSTAGLQWVVDGYALMYAAFQISGGAISDRIGAKRMFAAGIAGFTLASAACGLAPAMWFLVAARVVQGTAAALIMPASLALVRQAFGGSPAERARAIALWTVGGATALAAGPVVGGVLTAAVSWRAIFFVNLPVGMIVLFLSARAPTSPRRSVPLDWPGQVTLVVALATLTYGVISGGQDGFGPAAVACLLVAGAAFGAFLAIEARSGHPMVPLGLFRSRTVSVAVAIGFAVNSVFYGVIFVLSLYFQRILGMSALTAGLMFVPMTALLPLANLASAWTAARAGSRLPMWTGQLLTGLTLLALASAGTAPNRWLVAGLLAPLGFGLAYAIPQMTVVLLEAIPAAQAGMAAGLLNSSRQIGSIVAVAVFGTLVAQRATFGSGMRDSLLIVAVLQLSTTAAALLMPRRA